MSHADANTDRNVLQLVTTARPFFKEQVTALERIGYDCTTLSVPRPPQPTEAPRSVRHYLRYYPGVLRQSLRSWDVVHANFGLVAPFALAQPRRPVVVSLWGSDVFGQYGWIGRWCARHCDATIVMSEEMAAELGQECHVIPHGIDMQRFKPRPQGDAQADLGWDPEKKHVLFPYAPFRDVKDYPRAERVVETASVRVDDGIELHVVYGVPHARVPTYMNAADALLLTSKREGSPNSVKEALACNLPVISTDVGDVRERIEGISHSYLCDTDGELRDALVSVLSKDVRSNGRARAEHVSLDHMGRQIAEVYETVIAQRE